MRIIGIPGIFCFLLALTLVAAPRDLSDRTFVASHETFSQACEAAVKTKTRLVVNQKWKVESATCAADVWFGKTGSITYSGNVAFGGLVNGTADAHFVRETGGTLSFPGPDSTLYLSWWGAVADGTDESTKFQAALDAAHTSGGGKILIAFRRTCYLAENLQFYSNTTIFSESLSTCVKKPNGGGPYQMFRNDYAEPVSNVHFRNFTIDGNRDNQPGIKGDGGLMGVYFAGASDSSIEQMVIRNAYTDGVIVGCWGYYPDHVIGAGTGVSILHSLITNSRRNNISVVCGNNTVVRDSQLSYAHGTSPEAGIDVEPDYAGQSVDGFQIENTELFGNAESGLLIQAKSGPETMAALSVNAHDNGAFGMSSVDYSGAGEFRVVGGVFANNHGGSGIKLAGWARSVLSGEAVYGSAIGIVVMANMPNTVLGPSVLSGSDSDLTVEGPNATVRMSGVRLVHGTHKTTGAENCPLPLYLSPELYPLLSEFRLGCTMVAGSH